MHCGIGRRNASPTGMIPHHAVGDGFPVPMYRGIGRRNASPTEMILRQRRRAGARSRQNLPMTSLRRLVQGANLRCPAGAAVSPTHVGDGFPVPLHCGIGRRNASPTGMIRRQRRRGRVSRPDVPWYREAKRLPYGDDTPSMPYVGFGRLSGVFLDGMLENGAFFW